MRPGSSNIFSASRVPRPVWVVPELGHAAPSYGLTGFGDTWRDVLTVVKDLRQLWRNPSH
jgi:hypothetical protein